MVITGRRFLAFVLMLVGMLSMLAVFLAAFHSGILLLTAGFLHVFEIQRILRNQKNSQAENNGYDLKQFH